MTHGGRSCSLNTKTKEINPGDFPGGPVIKNLPSKAGDAGSIPGWGTLIPHAMGQLSRSASTIDPVTTTGEKFAHHNERSQIPQRRPNVAK